MIFDNFWTFTDQFVSFSRQEKEQIKRQLSIRDVPRHHVLINTGEVADEIFFINKGCVRLYYLTNEGEEITGFIFLENMMAGSSESFFSQIPGTQIIETLEECELLVLTYEKLEQLYTDVPRMNILVRKILEQRMAFAQKVVASLIINKPQDRYSSYQQLHPGLENRIPQHVLASYMGITPVSLSRIRKRLSKGE
ncbi:CRP-like cAMP-binding protein [Catalinimonas alkaloidigena]|uniref:Crp/Fnr family transcriptional regulator n=1 Tax=Catalinimonas alkaloidigena TaxID=1075417 RepID=UPI002406ED28|nr:Crp/Fnr family transcriptional regulator [Catalinimonas alkaloidigena]MDF9795041.1 CRP-like cAMP-binding protein [Catalinimonas alkaloidigena]